MMSEGRSSSKQCGAGRQAAWIVQQAGTFGGLAWLD